MKIIDFKTSSRKNISALALGPESAGNFSVYDKGKIYLSEDFGDLLEDKNFKRFKKGVLGFLRKNKIKPKAVLTDLHPLYKTTVWGAELAKKFGAKHIRIQHHLAHILSVIGSRPGTELPSGKSGPKTVFGIACDGTGYGLDGKIWGGEVFQVKSEKLKVESIKRIGRLENQIMIGGDLAVKEPTRMLISILAKFLKKDGVYKLVKKHYSRNQFELLYSQMEQNFNCQETSSTGRVLDAVSVLLGFSGNERKYKHSPVDLLEKNSAKPYGNLKPKIKNPGTEYCLLTTPLFEYLVKNLHRDKKRLAATAQLYLAEGLYEITNRAREKKSSAIYFAGGMANNKIMSGYMKSKGAIMNEKIPRGDAGLSFGQIAYYLSANPGD